MVGDSHTIQWAPAMAEIGQQENWEVQLMARRGCRLAAPVRSLGPIDTDDKCWLWRVNALAALEQLRPDAVVVVGSRTSTTGPGDTVIPAESRARRRLAAAGIRVITIRDNPRFRFDVPACVEEHPDGVGCARDRADAFSPVNPVEESEGVPLSAVHLDLSRFICGARLCEGTAGNVLIYRDDNHMTATYAATLTRPLHNSLRTKAPWLFVDPMKSPPVRTRF
jgi:hypothetical protein